MPARPPAPVLTKSHRLRGENWGALDLQMRCKKWSLDRSFPRCGRWPRHREGWGFFRLALPPDLLCGWGQSYRPGPHCPPFPKGLGAPATVRVLDPLTSPLRPSTPCQLRAGAQELYRDGIPVDSLLS